MIDNYFELYVEKKPGFNDASKRILKEINDELHINSIKKVRLLNYYIIENINKKHYEQSIKTIFSDAVTDFTYENNFSYSDNSNMFTVESLPGQYNQRADSAEQCLQILTHNNQTKVQSLQIFILEGDLTESELLKIKSYYINPLECRERINTADPSLHKSEFSNNTQLIDNFIHFTKDEMTCLSKDYNLALNLDDLLFCQNYFKKEKRNPSITELKVIDTYWSDHCRHTTFLTELENITFEGSPDIEPIHQTYLQYKEIKSALGLDNKPKTLMDMALLGMKSLKQKGLLNDLEESDEINACSIKITVNHNGEDEDWLLMFKNETHNHPTEIEPFGGASTCLGGAIRDPLSGRSYVYQAMRVTGSGDPRKDVSETISGKLSQRKITLGAAHGYSSYGNQIGLATGHVSEIYHEGYQAKRLEIGAVVGATKASHVKRDKPSIGDVIVLIGGRTGRDGCGGASGSSKKHTENSLSNCGAEVQKGNAPTERKLQRLFRKEKFATLIKKCNDFGAGGVSVAIGELADSLIIDLDKVKKKYDGLNGTELAISESQERMAVLVDPSHYEKIIDYAMEENLEAVKVAEVTDNQRLIMTWRGETILDLDRGFLDTNGVMRKNDVYVKAPNTEEILALNKDIKTVDNTWLELLSDLNICSQKGLVEMFDSTIGSGSVTMPFGGKSQMTPTQSMVCKIPVLNGDTTTCSAMAYGFNPYLSEASPYHGAVYALIDSIAKLVAVGVDYKNIRLTLQEYFERLNDTPEKWGKPFAALLGALKVQIGLGIPAIGGKDSMSGTFEDLHVPPTLVSFAVGTINAHHVITPELKAPNNKIYLVQVQLDEHHLPNFNTTKYVFEWMNEHIKNGQIKSAYAIGTGGIAEALSKMCFGNMIGVELQNKNMAFGKQRYGSFIVEIDGSNKDLINELNNFKYTTYLGNTTVKPTITHNGNELNLSDLVEAFSTPLEKVFPTNYEATESKDSSPLKEKKGNIKIYGGTKLAKPKIFIPIFPGTNCEYDLTKAFIEAGGEVDTYVFKNLSTHQIDDSLKIMIEHIKSSQIIMLPGGFSAGDEPDGSGKFISTIFRNPRIQEETMQFLKEKDGLMLGICNGFQALIKLGLLPYGEIKEIDKNAPTLTYNKIGRHISCIAETEITSTQSPWLQEVSLGDKHMMPLSHGEGRFVADDNMLSSLEENKQIVTKYTTVNPNGSYNNIEGIISPDGRILGKMGHSERIGSNLYKNIHGTFDQKLFQSGINYFK